MQRVFKAIDRYGAEIEFELLEPNMATEGEGERQYKIAYSKALAEGIYPREKLREIMKSHNMWSEDDEDKIRLIVGEIGVLQTKLQEAEAVSDSIKCLEISKQLFEKRNRMWELFLIRHSVYMNSAEGLAEIIKTESIMAASTVIKASKQRYWKNYTEYVKERDENIKSTVYVTVMSIQNELLNEMRERIENEYPERKYLNSKIDEEVTNKIVTEEIEKRKQKALEDVGVGSTESSISGT